jgi:hypothetical protein
MRARCSVLILKLDIHVVTGDISRGKLDNIDCPRDTLVLRIR